MTFGPNAEEADGLSKAAELGKLKQQKDWTSWHGGLGNCVATIHGQDRVPLSHVIREEAAPNCTIKKETDCSFERLSTSSRPVQEQCDDSTDDLSGFGPFLLDLSYR